MLVLVQSQQPQAQLQLGQAQVLVQVCWRPRHQCWLLLRWRWRVHRQ